MVVKTNPPRSIFALVILNQPRFTLPVNTGLLAAETTKAVSFAAGTPFGVQLELVFQSEDAFPFQVKFVWEKTGEMARSSKQFRIFFMLIVVYLFQPFPHMQLSISSRLFINEFIAANFLSAFINYFIHTEHVLI